MCLRLIAHVRLAIAILLVNFGMQTEFFLKRTGDVAAISSDGNAYNRRHKAISVVWISQRGIYRGVVRAIVEMVAPII